MSDFFIIFFIIILVVTSIAKRVNLEQKKAQQRQREGMNRQGQKYVHDAFDFQVNEPNEPEYTSPEGIRFEAVGDTFQRESEPFGAYKQSKTAPEPSGQSMQDIFTEGSFHNKPQQGGKQAQSAVLIKKQAPTNAKVRSRLMEGIILSEVLGKPKALRD